jgi:hypothetical protein
MTFLVIKIIFNSPIEINLENLHNFLNRIPIFNSILQFLKPSLKFFQFNSNLILTIRITIRIINFINKIIIQYKIINLVDSLVSFSQ